MSRKYAFALRNTLDHITQIRKAIGHLPDFLPFECDPQRQEICRDAIGHIAANMRRVPAEIRHLNPAMQGFWDIHTRGLDHLIQVWHSSLSALNRLEPEIKAELERIGPNTR